MSVMKQNKCIIHSNTWFNLRGGASASTLNSDGTEWVEVKSGGRLRSEHLDSILNDFLYINRLLVFIYRKRRSLTR